MTRDQQIKTLNSPKAGKEQLREALAASLGVEYTPKEAATGAGSFARCRDVFLEAYRRHTGVAYSFTRRDGIALSELLSKLEEKAGGDPCPSFKYIMEHLPDWYRQNAFSLPVINSKLNEIIASIRRGGRQNGLSDDYRAGVLADLAT